MTAPRVHGPPPSGIRISRSPQLCISCRWLNDHSVAQLLLAIAWNAGLLFWYFTATIIGSTLFLVVPLLHVALGVYFTYIAAIGLLNRTTIYVQPDILSVRHGPLPWLPNRDFLRSDVKQLYCERDERLIRGQQSSRFTLQLVLRSGPRYPLLKHLELSRQARFVEAQLEEALGIQDKAMPGEYQGTLL